MTRERTTTIPRAWSALPTFALGALLSISAVAVTPVERPGPLRLAETETVRPAKPAGDVYIVQLREASTASYKGETTGFAATKPQSGQRFDAHSAAATAYAKHLEDSHDRMLAALGTGTTKIYSFRYAFNGFAAELTGAEVSRLARQPAVARIWRDTEQQVQTNNSSRFLGLLDQTGGLRADLKLTGEDVVIGIIDSGVAPNHSSLRDFTERLPRLCSGNFGQNTLLGRWLCRPFRKNPIRTQTYQPHATFRGVCQEGDGFTAANCNNKLVGARYYVDGFLFQNMLDPGEFMSPKDADGHGTHLATIVAGNATTASLFGTRIGEISGIAPRARVAVYKACWLKPGETRASCATSDLARAIDDAVADGVDIINYSVGSLETDLTAPEDIALLSALDAGVLSVVAAGNDGPDNFTIGSPSSAPWVLTAAASTQTGTRYEQGIDVVAPSDIAGSLSSREASFTPQLSATGAIEAALVLLNDDQDVLTGGGVGSTTDACEPAVNTAELAGAVALIERGGCDFTVKLERAEAAGSIAAVVYNTSGEPIVMNGEIDRVGIPAVMIGTADGDQLVAALVAGDTVTVRLEHGILTERRDTGNQMAAFSSRGPSLSESDFVKPDVTAPGVNILAGSSPDLANGVRGENFQYLSGTSMAAPMVAGSAALLKEAHPSWAPGTLKSALMTTAYADVVTENAEFDANPFDMGSGHIDPNLALNPGLVYESGFSDHAAYLCGLHDSNQPQAECDQLALDGASFAPEALNLPSIGVTELIPGDMVTRRVTNIGPPGTYQATLAPPPGISATVSPSTLSLGTGQSAEYTISFDNAGAVFDFWQFGNLHLSDGSHDVNTPIAVQPVLLRAPEEISLNGPSGTDQLPVDFGYADQYFVNVHGLHEPGLSETATVDNDPTNNFSFRFDNGVNGHFFTVQPGELFMRVALFDELTDGADDLDLYLYHCPTLNSCTEVGQSGSFTSDETIDLVLPAAGFYTALVHGFDPDPAAGGPGAEYELNAWSFGPNDDRGNLRITAPATVVAGDRLALDYDWGPLDPAVRYLGAVSHDTPFDVFFLTIVTVNLP